MKEILKSRLSQMTLLTVLFAFILSPLNKAWSVGIVPIKGHNSATIQTNTSESQINSNEDGSKNRPDVLKGEHKPTRKEIKKFLKTQEPDLLPETNLEWFFLLVSGVGLFIAILGGLGGFGWLIFGGGLITYLFYKLLKN